MTDSATFLTGRAPQPADTYRVEINRRRWYRDPLPGCPIAPETTTVFPSVTTIKGARPTDWSHVNNARVAAAYHANNTIFDGMDPQQIGRTMLQISSAGLRAAGDRGTNVHTIAEHLLDGTPHGLADDAPGLEYAGTVAKMLADMNATPYALEAVLINRTIGGTGFGGTADAFLEINGDIWLVDWKSRSANSSHGAYPLEATQLGGYSLADYMLIDGRRYLLPELAGALIVSIKPDSWAYYPVDLKHAQTDFVALHTFWVHTETPTQSIGKALRTMTRQTPVVAPVKAANMVSDQSRQWLRNRCTHLHKHTADGAHLLSTLAWPTGCPSLATDQPLTADHYTAICAALDTIEANYGVPFYRPDPTTVDMPPMQLFDLVPTPAPVEGDTLKSDHAAVTELMQQVTLLTPPATDWLISITKQANDVGRSLSITQHATMRRVMLATGLVTVAPDAHTNPVLTGEVLTALVGHVCDRANIITPTGATIGAVVSALDVDTAITFAVACHQFATGQITISYTADGALKLQHADNQNERNTTNV